jgi:hypothetical protein
MNVDVAYRMVDLREQFSTIVFQVEGVRNHSCMCSMTDVLIGVYTDEQTVTTFFSFHSRGIMATTVINPALDNMPTYIFSELPGSVKQRCETCHNGFAAFRWVKHESGVTAGYSKVICRVCASLIVLIGKPC